MNAPGGRQPRKRGLPRPKSPWVADIRSQGDLFGCVVMLANEFIETERVNGQDLQIWLKAPRSRRARPKMTRHLGTGFLLACDDRVFLVTARHVARRMGPRARMLFTGRGGAARVVALARLVGRRGAGIGWTHHPTADVSVARVVHAPGRLRGRFLPAAMLPAKTVAPSGTVDLLVVGFPLGIINPRNLTPIAKRMHAASGVLQFCGDEMSRPAVFFLLDQPTMAGYSGAPVLIVQQPGRNSVPVTPLAMQCVGLVSQTISDEGGAQFAAVVPGAVIRRMVLKGSRARAGALAPEPRLAGRRRGSQERE